MLFSSLLKIVVGGTNHGNAEALSPQKRAGVSMEDEYSLA